MHASFLCFMNGLQLSSPKLDALPLTCRVRRHLVKAAANDNRSTDIMAPDINSLPSSPRQDRQPTPQTSSNTPSSRRTSQQMLPPAAPASASHALPHRSPVMTSNEPTGLPLRHPRPMTAAELYLECEKEQEAVVRHAMPCLQYNTY